MPFTGNNDCTITAINTSGGIACSQTSGSTPCFVQASASAITCTGTRITTAAAVPYEDLEYTWDFGDPSGTETFVNPVTGLTVNANSGQIGPEAAYCYRTAGTKTITLSIRGKNGGSYTTTSVTQNITVSAFNPSGGEYWFDSVAGLTANSGLDAAHPKGQAFSDITALVAANVRMNFKCGSDWTGNLALNSSNFRIQSYGSGAKPIIRTASGGGAIKTNLGTGTATDVVVSNLNAISSEAGGYGAELVHSNGATGFLTHYYLDNCTVSATASFPNCAVIFQKDAGSNGTTGGQSKCGLWNCVLTTPSTGTSTTSFVSMFDWFFIVGGSLSQGGQHLIYPNVQTHQLYRWVTFTGHGGGDYAINGNWDVPGGSGTNYAEFWNFSSLDVSGMSYAFDMSLGAGGGTSIFRNVVAEGCAFHALIGYGVTQSGMAITVTYRDNHYWNTMTGGAGYSTGSTNTALCFYRNKVYNPTGGSGSGIMNFGAAASWTVKGIFTDNIFQDMRSTSLLWNLESWSGSLGGSYVNRNQYYTPNDTTPFGQNDTGQSLASWQAAGFDATVSTANPAWPDPANGDFGDVVTLPATGVPLMLAMRLRA